MSRLPTLSPEQRELFDLLSLHARHESTPPEPIAVVGIGCRFPGGSNCPDSFWRLLSEGRDAVSVVPPDRWDADALYDPNPDALGKMWTRHGGFLDEVDRFDAAFFGISPREASWMDPQQRLLLEVCWQALEHANIAPDLLTGSRTGVFCGLCTGDYFRLVYADRQRVGAYCATGTFPSAAAGRVSYALGLRGPCIAVDTACSSSLVAVHLACQSLRQKECEIALAGGASLILSPEMSINFTKARMLSPDGRSKTFDAAADGYSRGEGCGMLVLKPLSLAQRDGDTIWGVLLGSAINQDGHSNGLTAPNPVAQEELLRAALAAARVRPRDVSYIEAHGTGTPLGDPIEVGALAAVLGQDRPPARPLRIGTVKTNIGHLEIAAGVAGLIKTLLCLRHRMLVANLHFRQINPKIAAAIGDVPLEICQRLMPWEVPDGRWIAGVSSFGFGGTNAHIIVEGGPAVDGLAEGPTMGSVSGVQDSGAETGDVNQITDTVAGAYGSPHAPCDGNHHAEREANDTLHILCLSAKTRVALAALSRSYIDFLSRTDAAIGDVCYTANVGRSHFEHRLVVVGATCRELAEQLNALTAPGCVGDGDSAPHVARPDQPPSGAAAPAPAPTNGDPLARSSLAERYLRGEVIDWRSVYADASRRRVTLPSYPFQRERYWLTVGQAAFHPDESAVDSALVDQPVQPKMRSGDCATHPVQTDRDLEATVRLKSLTDAHPLLGRRLRTASRDIIFESHLTPTLPGWLADHLVRGSVVLPGAAYVELALAAAHASTTPHATYSSAPAAYRLLTTKLSQFLPLASAGRLLQTVLTPQSDGWQFACYSADASADPDVTWILHASGVIAATATSPTIPDTAAPTPSSTLPAARACCSRRRDSADYYDALAAIGLEYGPAFRGIRELWSGDHRALARLVAPKLSGGERADYTVNPAFLDACLQTFLAALEHDADLYVPAGWERLELLAHSSRHAPREENHHPERDGYGLALRPGDGQSNELWAFAELSGAVPGDEASCLTGRLTVFDSASMVVARWSGIRLRRIPRPAILSVLPATPPPAITPGASEPTPEAVAQRGAHVWEVVHECAVRVLELPPEETIGSETNLYNLGMDSIMATELLFHIEKALGCALPMQAMTKCRTLTQIAEMVRLKSDESAAKSK